MQAEHRAHREQVFNRVRESLDFDNQTESEDAARGRANLSELLPPDILQAWESTERRHREEAEKDAAR